MGIYDILYVYFCLYHPSLRNKFASVDAGFGLVQF